MPAPMITGWGKCLPPAVLSNADLEKLTDTSDEWIVCLLYTSPSPRD